MSEVKITDLVPQETIDKIKELDTEMHTLLTDYTNIAKELAKGVDINVRVIGDIDKLEKLLVEKTKEATEQTQRLNAIMEEKNRIIANTTNVAARQLMEQERVNKTRREEYTEYDRVKKLLENFNGSYDDHLKRLVSLKNQLAQNSKEQKDNEKALKQNRISMEEYQAAQAKLIEQHRYLTQEKRTLSQMMTAEEKAMQTADTSYVQMNQQLELLRKAWKDLGVEARNGDIGQNLENAIQNLDAHLNDLSADVGEHQRNVGNYAIAAQQGIATTDSVIAAMNQEARTTQDLIDQTKILEEAKLMLNKEDANYQSTLDSLNAKIEENKRKLSDVCDIIGKEARSVSEAEAQNKRLSEAIKHIDLTSADAKKKLEEMRNQIQRNNETIASATGANEKFADSILNIIGVNANFGSSFQTLGQNGNFVDGLNTKVKALSKTLMGLLANPWVLAFLGIAGVVAGFKWWYDYNKGLVEATKLTKDFTGLTGDELKAVRNEVQAVADTYDKDFREVMEAANALSKQFGISFQESMQLIEDGFISGADVNGEFIENIKEYPAYFKEAGISASEFIAITSKANQAGIYSDKGIDVIKEGNLRIREMTKSTADALNAIGISSKEVQQSLADGSQTTFDIMQQVSEKLAEFPESSTEVGTALADIFGGPGEDAGLQYILTLKDIDTNLDNVKDRAGELGEIQEEQLRSQIELENIIASVFDATGGSFESMTAKAKIFVNDGIIAIIKGCVDIVNWFVRLYNKSVAVRYIFNAIVNSFKTLWAAAKFVLSQIVSGFKSLGDIIEGVFTLDVDKIKAGYQKGLNAFKDNFNSLVSEIRKNAEDAVRETLDGQMQEVTLNVTSSGYTPASPSGKPKGNPNYTPKETDAEKKAREKAAKEASKSAKEAEKQAKEELKRINELEEAKISIMADGHEKELAMIRLKFKKKIDEIKGDGETEKALRVQLAEQCEKEVADCEDKYQKELAKINLENRLASVKEGSKEELDLKLAKLEQSRQAELKEAEKTGADVSLIEAKFEKEKLKLKEDYANNQADLIMKQFSVENEMSETNFILQSAELRKQYNEKLRSTHGYQASMEKAEEDFNKKMEKLTKDHAIAQAKATVEMYQKMLESAELSAEKRLEIERALARAIADLHKLEADSQDPKGNPKTPR